MPILRLSLKTFCGQAGSVEMDDEIMRWKRKKRVGKNGTSHSKIMRKLPMYTIQYWANAKDLCSDKHIQIEYKISSLLFSLVLFHELTCILCANGKKTNEKPVQAETESEKNCTNKQTYKVHKSF